MKGKKKKMVRSRKRSTREGGPCCNPAEHFWHAMARRAVTHPHTPLICTHPAPETGEADADGHRGGGNFVGTLLRGERLAEGRDARCSLFLCCVCAARAQAGGEAESQRGDIVVSVERQRETEGAVAGRPGSEQLAERFPLLTTFPLSRARPTPQVGTGPTQLAHARGFGKTS